jgi:hypothetical protein
MTTYTETAEWLLSAAKCLDAGKGSKVRLIDETPLTSAEAVTRQALGPIRCAHWCEDSDTGHADESVAADQVCMGATVSVPSSNGRDLDLYLIRNGENAETEVSITRDGLAGLDLTLAGAVRLRDALDALISAS